MQIFIGGTGRSGTTITGKILGLHPEIFYPSLKYINKTINPELRLIIDPDGCIDLINDLSINWSPQKADLAIHRFVELVKKIMKQSKISIKRHFEHYLFGNLFPKLNFSGPRYGYSFYGDIVPRKYVLKKLNNFIDSLIECQYNGQWIGSYFSLNSKIYNVKRYNRTEIALKCGQFIDEIFQIKMKPPFKYWCDSTPYNILYAKDLLSMFPKAKIIHIYRDPRDVISSYITKSWGGNQVDDVIGMIYRIWERWLKIKKELNQNQLFEIKLEEFYEKFEIIISKLFRFLEVKDLLNKNKINILKDDSFRRFKRDLSNSEISRINSKFRNILKNNNYKI